MALQIIGPSGNVVETDGGKAIRTVVRGIDPGALGCYRMSVRTGLMAAGLAANSEIYQFRWADATRLAIIDRITFDGMGSVTAFAAGVASFYATAARAWTAVGSGGTAVTMSGNNQKQRTSFGTSLLSASGDARIASTAALTAGTKTLDAQDFGQAVGGVTATAGAGIPPQPMMDVLGVGYPEVLANQEGFVIRATVPATGTWTAGFTIHWTEVTAY